MDAKMNDVTLTTTNVTELSLLGDSIKLTSIAGLETAPIRTSSYSNSGEDGGFVDSQFYSARLLTFTGVIHNTNCNLKTTARDAMITASVIRENVQVKISTNDGKYLTTTGRVIGFDMPYTSSLKYEFKLDLFCDDPLLYDLSAGSQLCVSLERYVASGLEWPLVWPLVWGIGSAGVVTAINTGVVTTYPTITINGTVTNPKITNITTGELFELAITTSGSDTIIVNTKDNIVTLNGSSIYSLITPQSTFWKLNVGSNDLIFETTDAADTGEVTVCWLPAYLGI